MIRGNIFGRDVCLQGSPYTLLVFKQEFDEDLIGFMTNLETTDIEGYLRIAWAMARTYDDEVDYYERWLEEFEEYDGFDLEEKGQAALCVIVSAINAELFCRKKTFKQRLGIFVVRRFCLR